MTYKELFEGSGFVLLADRPDDRRRVFLYWLAHESFKCDRCREPFFRTPYEQRYYETKEDQPVLCWRCEGGD